MVQWVRMLAALAEDLSLVPSIYITAHNHMELQEIRCPLLAFEGSCRHMVHTKLTKVNAHTCK